MPLDADRSAARAPLIFGYAYAPLGIHPSGWGAGENTPDAFDPAHVTSVAQLAESAGFDFLQIAERATPGGGIANVARTEPFTTASFLATRTQRIGFVVAGNTSYAEPFNLTRLAASLDHVTHGRASLQIVTGAERAADINFSVEPASAEAHHARADEVIGVARTLWDSWEDDAFLRDKVTGDYVDGTKIHAINHRGPLFAIRGPLNVARPPQGQLVITIDVTSPLTRDLAAREADIAILSVPAAQVVDQARALRTQAEALGRDPAHITILAHITPIIGATDADAQRFHRDLNAGIPADSSYDPGLFGEIIGGPAEIAQAIAERAVAQEVDGFLVHVARSPDQLQLYADLVLPELRQRDLLRTDDRSITLRERLGLERALSRFAAA